MMMMNIVMSMKDENDEEKEAKVVVGMGGGIERMRGEL